MPPKKDNNSSSIVFVNGLTITAATTTTTTTANAATTEATIAEAAAAAASSTSTSDIAAEQRQQLYLANSKLCRLVKKCPWMYNRHHANYAKKHVLDKSWTKIAKDCNDSVASCKERWRNIRAAFARSINIYKTHGGPNRVKPYYLHKELNFLVKPMMDGRERFKINLEESEVEVDASDDEPASEVVAEIDNKAADTIVQPEEEKHEEDNPNLDTQLEFISDVEADFSFPEEVQQEIAATISQPRHNNAPAIEEPECKRIKLSSSPPCSPQPVADPDAKFLDALLPDMKSMNARQKIVFKRKIYQSLEEVFETNVDFPNQSSRLSASPHTVSSAAQNVINGIGTLNESELQKLHAFMHNNFRKIASPAITTSGSNRLQNGAVTSTPNTQTHTINAKGRQNTSGRNGGGSSASPWDQLVPMTIKDEVEDVDID